MRWIVFLFIAGLLFTTSQATSKLEKDLVVYFTFDKVEDEKILDASGNDLDAEVIANVDFVEGKYGDAIHIAAEPEGGDCVRVPADDLLEIEDEITMAAWVYHEDWQAASGLWVDKGSRTLGEQKGSYGIEFSDIIPELGWSKIYMTLGGGQKSWGFIGAVPMVDRNWHHIAGTYDGKVAKMYLDGEIFYDHDRRFKFAGTNELELRIGCAGHPRYVFKDGSIDEFGIWRRALTEAEIAEAMKGFLAVSPKDKVATTWGDIKHRTITDE